MNKIDIVYERQWSSLPNVVAALQKLGMMGHLYGGFPKFRYVKSGISPKIIRTFPVAALWNHSVRRLTLPKKLLADEARWVGDWVARSRDLAPWIWANGTAHRFLFPKLAETGRTLILERGSTHPENLFLQPQIARKDAGYPYTLEVPRRFIEEVQATHLATGIIAASEHVRQSYIERGFFPDMIHDGSFGIDTEAFPFHLRSVPTNRKIRLLTVGIIGFRKGLHRLLKMGEWAIRKNIDLELHFAGPIYDPEAHEMFEKSSAVCIRHGTVKNEALMKLFRDSDMYALPAYEEGLPFSVLEAMSTGLAAIVSNDTGAREPVQHGVSGLILRRFDDEEFDSELEPILRNPEKFVTMGLNARARIEENYTVEHYFQRIETALNKIELRIVA